MPRAANPPVPLDPRKQAQVQQETAMAGLADFDLPRTVVTRLAKAQVGERAKLSADVISALIKSSTVFINYLAAAAQAHAESKNRKTLNYDDIVAAVRAIRYGESEAGIAEIEGLLAQEIDAWDQIQAKSKSTGVKSGGGGGKFGKTVVEVEGQKESAIVEADDDDEHEAPPASVAGSLGTRTHRAETADEDEEEEDGQDEEQGEDDEDEEEQAGGDAEQNGAAGEDGDVVMSE